MRTGSWQHLGWLAGSAALAPALALAQAAGDNACSDWAEAVAVDGWQRTVVAGTTADNRILEWDGGHAHYGDMAVARLTPEGTLDRSFGDGGSTVLDVGDFDGVKALALRGRAVLAAGTTAMRDGPRSGETDIVVFRLDHDGRLDPSFGTEGHTVLDLGGSESVEALIYGPWGESYIVGAIEHGDESDGYIARLRADGRLDASFADGGVARFHHNGAKVKLFGARLLWDGLVAGGQRVEAAGSTALAVRVDTAGRRVSGFGEGGVSAVELPGELGGDGACAHTVLGATQVFVSVADGSGEAKLVSVAFDADGAPEPEKQLQIDVPGGTSDSVSASRFRGNRLYLVGGTYPEGSESGDAFLALTSRRAEGLDPRFAGGIVTAHYALEYAAFNALAPSHFGVTVAGWDFGESPESLPPSDAVVARYRHDGTLDAGFADGGVAHVDFRAGAAVCGPRVVVE